MANYRKTFDFQIQNVMNYQLGFFFWSFVSHCPIFLRHDRNIFGLFGHNDQKLFPQCQHSNRRFLALQAYVKK